MRVAPSLTLLKEIVQAQRDGKLVVFAGAGGGASRTPITLKCRCFLRTPAPLPGRGLLNSACFRTCMDTLTDTLPGGSTLIATIKRILGECFPSGAGASAAILLYYWQLSLTIPVDGASHGEY